ncbi:MAG: FliM/FliN family flagellar motor switch protein [Acidobacteriota bacterium]
MRKTNNLSKLIQLLSTAFAKENPKAAISTLEQLGASDGSQLLWRRLSFEGLPEFQLWVGAAAKSEAEASAADMALSKVFERFAVLLSDNLAKPVASHKLSEVTSLPDAHGEFLKITGTTIGEELLVIIPEEPAAWLAAHGSPDAKTSNRWPVLDALMNIELPVLIRLASKEIQLSEVLKWGPGSLVEFEAGLADPVDVIVNNQVVARGSVVLTDGCYGVRVSEVLPGRQTVGAEASV